MRSRRPDVELAVVEDDSDRHADPAETLRSDDDVGLDPVLLERVPGARPTAARLDLVDDHRNVQLARELAHALG